MSAVYKVSKFSLYLNAILVLLVIFSRVPVFLRFSGSFVTPIIIVTIQLFLILTILKGINIKSFVRDSKWIILSLVILVIYFLVSYGNTNGLLSRILVLYCTIPAFILGYYLGFSKRRNILYFIISIAYWVVFSITIFTFTRSGSFVYDDIYSSGDLTKNYFILYWPFVFIIANVGFFTMVDNFRKNRKLSILLFGSYILMLISIFLTTFTAPIMLTFIFFIFYFYFREKLKAKTIIMTSSAIVTIFLLMTYISKSELPAIASISKELAGFTSFIRDGKYSGLEIVSNGRMALLPISINSFIESPFIGKGAYWATNRQAMVASQHSSIFDMLAFYGMLGLPILMIYLNFIKHYLKRNKSNNIINFKDQMIVSFLCVFSSILIISFFNPYLFSFIPSDAIYMLMGGYILGNKNVNPIYLVSGSKRII